jgi:hypothetical protein
VFAVEEQDDRPRCPCGALLPNHATLNNQPGPGCVRPTVGYLRDAPGGSEHCYRANGFWVHRRGCPCPAWRRGW